MKTVYQLSVNKVLEQFETNAKGLSQSQAEQRLEKNGANELPQGKKQSKFLKFLSQFKDIMILILLAAADTGFHCCSRD